MSPKKHHYFEFLLFDGFSNLVLASALEPLRDVKKRAILSSLEWKISSLDGLPAVSSSSLRLEPDLQFEPEIQSRTLFLVAGYQMREQVSAKLSVALRQAARLGNRIIALDTASWFLAEAGLLEGQSATIHWHERESFKEKFPRIDVTSNRFETSGRIVTCGGASSVLEMVLALIHDRFGPVAAFDATSMFVFDPSQQTELRQSERRLRNTGSPKIFQSLNIMAKNIETPMTTFELANMVSVSERSLNRLFTKELGMTPGKYFKLVRLQRARYLAEESRLSMDQIALRCGFSCGSALGRSFERTYGTSLGSIR